MKEYTGFDRKRTFYHQDPDYTRPLFEIPAEVRTRMRSRLRFLYGEKRAEACLPEMD
jgi:hypothetical protein